MPTETLHIITLCVCVFTLILATAALMPSLKRAVSLVRDALIMVVMAVFLTLAGFVGWGKVFEIRERVAQESPSDSFAITDLFDNKLTNEELDPLPLPTAEDELREQRLADSYRSDFSANRSSAPLHASRRRDWSTSGTESRQKAQP